MKHIQTFESFLNEAADPLQSTEITVSGDASQPENWSKVANWVWTAYKSGLDWKISFVLPKVAEFEMESYQGIKINPLTDLKEELFKEGQGTNFDSSVMYNWYKKKGDIPYALSILVRNCSRVAFADKVKTDLKVDYNLNLQKFGFIPGEHVFDPGNRADDLRVWVEYAPRVITAQGSFSAFKPELEKALAELEKFLPNKLTVKAEIL